MNTRTQKVILNCFYLFAFFFRGHDEICSILITAGADINHADDAFNTALHYASMHGHNKVIELLLRKPSL